MLMLNEINTAANYGLGAVWIVLERRALRHDRAGHAVGRLAAVRNRFSTHRLRRGRPRAWAADGVRVEREADVAAALQAGLASLGPFVIDVIIDPSESLPPGSATRAWSSRA